MTSRWSELVEFPCDYEFKVFGPNGEVFVEAVRGAVSRTVPLSREALRTRASRAGSYCCVTVVVRLQGAAQIEAIYRELGTLEGLLYLL